MRRQPNCPLCVPIMCNRIAVFQNFNKQITHIMVNIFSLSWDLNILSCQRTYCRTIASQTFNLAFGVVKIWKDLLWKYFSFISATTCLYWCIILLMRKKSNRSVTKILAIWRTEFQSMPNDSLKITIFITTIQYSLSDLTDHSTTLNVQERLNLHSKLDDVLLIMV